MAKIIQAGEWAADNRGILAYMHHMEQTAQPKAAKRVFELFAQHEMLRMESNSARVLVSS